MAVQRIQSDDSSVASLFQSFYAVPDYQREYVWETEQVEQLLTDVREEMGDGAAQDAPEYFIGSIVVCPGREGVLDLIDGQQRMTTLYVTLCAIRDRLAALGAPASSVLNAQIADAAVDVSGDEQRRYRLDLQYEDSGDALVRLADGKEIDNPTTHSMRNMRNAHHVVTRFLISEFGPDVAAIRKFYGYLTNKVKLIRIQTEDVTKALKIFETINDRGVGLNSMDLLKNLLFMKTPKGQFDKLKDTWKELQDTIFRMGEKPLRFLRYFIFSRYDVELLREDEIYGWFSKNDGLVGYGRDPIGFAKELVSAARAYEMFRSGNTEKGQRNRYLDNIRLLGGQAARQHLILLLAGRHLPTALFDRLTAEVENLFFCYVITREPTRDFERNFAKWATELRSIRTEAELEAFISTRVDKEKVNLASRFDDAMGRLALRSLQLYRFQYVLAKLTQQVDILAYGETEGTRWLGNYVSGGYEVEHIFPQNPSDEAATEFGQISDPEVVQRLGNLVLVEKSINTSLGNRPYSEKRPVYQQSKLLLTRALSERPKVGTNTRIDRAVASIAPYPEWNEALVSDRQRSLVTLARAVWGLPEQAASTSQD
ncbi:MAG: hypothetical protein A3D16_20560 [Rhodobacterales bacterium RIFCSPHIGHO2_02_FULL_62_130]|nr:MAG: hypothetical protein A3D16_20560 [Rhodobacterales bacterium RIFCSPHIGHO2_02_FULL_62_130]OHC59568.1 MAG: hypothetical protein A3E48_01040 [Rhodobacterales bacterium RIFCSPHIGHO2_12_FULL_62_75]HCZ00212.1 DUF262 domain-containing protein [Rhodobacter sp.]